MVKWLKIDKQDKHEATPSEIDKAPQLIIFR